VPKTSCSTLPDAAWGYLSCLQFALVGDPFA